MIVEIFGSRILVVILAACLVGSCADREEAPKAAEAPATDRTQSRAAELERLRSSAPTWVSIYDPARAWNGYTLDFFHRTIPILIDMNGEIAHAWPEARVRARLRLLPNGNLLAIGLAQSIVEYDWDGNLEWEYRLAEGYAHHDLRRLDTGNTLMIVARRGEGTDDLLEVDRSGREVWRWESALHLADHFGDVAADERDITHLNSVQVLPANPWFEAGDERFRPGNVLISARNLNAIFLIDRETGKVVWRYDARLDRQHEALMIGPGYPGHGNIQIFNNGAKDRYTYRQSSVVEVDPVGGEVVWEYRAEGFFTSIVGVQQLLPNGNVLIGSGLGRRNFEVTRSGEVVWQWTPPFKTKRPTRYRYDYSPQFATLRDRFETPVVPREGYRHIDPLIYRFARERFRQKMEFDGRKRTVLKAKSGCREMILPEGARIDLTFGVDRARILESGASAYEARFAASLKIFEESRDSLVMQATVDLKGKSWRSHRWNLEALTYRRVELCLDEPRVIFGDAEISNSDSYWGNPAITGSADREIKKRSRSTPPEELNREELEVRQEHLEALGYID